MKLSHMFKYVLFRKKTVGPTFFQSPLKKCMNVMDVTFLGTGHIIGAGIWVMSGTILHEAGPAGLVLSYLFSAFVAFMASMMYAEFGGRIPKAGSVYSYGYIVMGEFWAFLVGWDLVLENLLGGAALAVGWSTHLDSILHGTQSAPKDIAALPVLAPKVDYIAVCLIFTVCIFIGLGVKSSSIANNILNVISFTIIIITVTFGLTFARTELWSNETYVKEKCPGAIFNQTSLSSVYLPNGFSAVLEASAKGFFAYIGFETMTSAGEEVKHARKTLPLGILLAVGISIVCYILMTVTLSLIVPYCDAQRTPFAHFFSSVHYEWARYLSSAGALIAMTSVMYGFLFSSPRGIYAMAADGLLCKWLAYVHPRTQVPLAALVVTAAFAALPALFFTLDFLTEMVSIGTLTAYNVMAFSIIVLRYRPDSCSISTNLNLDDELKVGKLKPCFAWLRFLFGNFQPGSAVVWITISMIPLMIGFSVILHFGFNLEPFIRWILLAVFGFMILLCVFFIFVHQQSNADALYFKVPLVPFVPTLSLFLNILFMMSFPSITWFRFGTWLCLGIIIYLAYGVYHSLENEKNIDVSYIPSRSNRTSSRRPCMSRHSSSHRSFRSRW